MSTEEPTQEELIRLVEIDDRAPVVYDWIRSVRVDQLPDASYPYAINVGWDRALLPQRLLYVGTGAEESTLEQMVLMGANLVFCSDLPLSVFDQRFHPMHFNIPVMGPHDQIMFRVLTSRVAAKGLLILAGRWWVEEKERP